MRRSPRSIVSVGSITALLGLAVSGASAGRRGGDDSQATLTCKVVDSRGGAVAGAEVEVVYVLTRLIGSYLNSGTYSKISLHGVAGSPTRATSTAAS